MENTGYNTADDTIKLEEYEEEAEGKVFGSKGDKVSMIGLVYPRDLVSVIYFGYFSCFGYYYKTSIYSLSISLLEHYKLKIISRKREGGS